MKSHKERESKEQRIYRNSLNVGSRGSVARLSRFSAFMREDTHSRRRDLSPSNALTGMHRSRL